MTSDRWLGFMHILLGALVGLLFLALIGVVCAPRRASAGSEGGQAPPTVSEAVVGASRLPQDPFQRCAYKAVVLGLWPLQEWQRVGYQRGLDIGARKARAWLTSYYPEEGFPRGQMCRWGYPVSERVAAANRLPARTFVWHPRTGIRQVLDTGARSNDRVAERKGAAFWCDFWEPRRGQLFGDDNGGVQTVWIIERRG